MKKYPTLGCCGIDCGLCPRYHIEGKSRCPGCGAKGFSEKHPSCSILTCCVKTRGLETCAICEQFPCSRIEKWDQADSFVTHRASIENLKAVRENGLAGFITQQQKRMQLLGELLREYDDGRSKSFYCLSAALLPPAELRAAVRRVKRSLSPSDDRKIAANRLREAFNGIASNGEIDLSYRKKAAGAHVKW